MRLIMDNLLNFGQIGDIYEHAKEVNIYSIG
jgi:hypothetical protein